MKRWVTSVNGERMFLEGLEPGPDPHGARRGDRRASSTRDVRLAKDAGLDLLRVHAHVTRPELYDAADAAGCCCGRTCRCSGATPAACASRRCARPARWSTCSATTRASRCGAATTSRSPSTPGAGDPIRVAATRSRGRPELPSWNKTVLDRSVGRGARARRPDPPGGRATPACCPASAAGGTDTPPLLRLVPRRRARLPRSSPPSRGWPASSPSSAPRPSRRRPTSCDPERGRTSTGTARSHHGLPEARCSTARAPGRLRHVRGVARRRPRRTRPTSSATTSRPAAAEVPARPAASASSASPTATRR